MKREREGNSRDEDGKDMKKIEKNRIKTQENDKLKEKRKEGKREKQKR